MNQPVEALAAMEKIIVQSAPSLNMELERAALIEQANGPEQAIETLEPLTELFPNNAQLYAALSDLYFEAGVCDSGLQAARWALQYDQDDLSVETESKLHYQIGWQLRRLGQLDLAIHHLSEAIHRAPENLEYYLELGRTHQDRRQNGQAIEIYQIASKLAPNDYRPFFQAGLALKDSKDYTEAETMFRRAAHLAPEETSIHRQLAAVVALNLVHNRRLPITE
jgi:tetratricopeptide (TPR) repeat protein